jgi:hypothetical protein
MAKLNIAREVYTSTQERSVLSKDEREIVAGFVTRGTAAISVDPKNLPTAFLRALLDDSRLTVNQRAALSMQIFGMKGRTIDPETVYDAEVFNPIEFGSTFALLGTASANCEWFLNGRWYPVVLNVQFVSDSEKVNRWVYLRASISLCETVFNLSRFVYSDLFQDDDGRPQPRTVREILQEFGFRVVQTEPTDFNLKLLRAERTSREKGRVVLVSAPVLCHPSRWWLGRQSLTLGTPESPRKAVIDHELEVPQDGRDYQAPQGQARQGVSRLPFVRVFSLDLKSFVYADVDDVALYEFDVEAMGRLHLPGDMLNVLDRVFNTPVEGLFGDLVRGKHGGVVILASGKPGVGKTLTAEVYAEVTQRPLYVLELGELGTSVAKVEESLQRVFTRVAAWKAVLQMDECEIFLTKRGEDLERSAIVGSFLRLLDYYQGILFLTTNRAEVLDHAVLSRVMLRLRYPDLDQNARAVIWGNMFQAAGMSLVEGTLEELAEADVNGRQIRNLTRLAKILYPDGRVTLEQMRGVLVYGSASDLGEEASGEA